MSRAINQAYNVLQYSSTVVESMQNTKDLVICIVVTVSKSKISGFLILHSIPIHCIYSVLLVTVERIT